MSHRLLAALVALRLSMPLAVLAASGRELPVLRDYDYDPVLGDAHAYLTTARTLATSWGRLGVLSIALLVAAVVVTGVVLRRLRRGRVVTPRLVVAAGVAVTLVSTALVLGVDRSAAGAVGWPLAWSIPLAPLHALGATSDDAAFAVGLLVSLAASAVTVLAVAFAAERATGSTRAAHAAAALAAAWPLLLAFALDPAADVNNTWLVATGLALYSEPLSIALVAAATAFALRTTPTSAAAAGVAFGFAVATRPTNVLLAVLALVLVTSRRRLVAYVAGALTVVPLLLAFELRPTGYALSGPGAEFALANLGDSFGDSTVRPVAFVVMAVVAIAGSAAVHRRARVFLLGSIAVTVGFYGLFAHTAAHPRYLLAALPALLVLAAAGFRGARSKDLVRIGAPVRHPG